MATDTVTTTSTALVTGAAGGIGAAVARRLIADGYEVAIVDRDADSVRAQAEALGPRAFALAGDVTDEASLRAAIDEVQRRMDHLDVLVASAGVASVGRFDDLDPAELERVYRVNVVGTYLSIKVALPLLRRAPGRARIVTIASVAGKVATPWMTAYGASKAAVIQLTRSAAAALAPDIRVNCCCPGAVDTGIWDVIDRGYEEAGAPPEMRSGQRPAQQLLPGAGTPDQIAGAVAFLAGEDSAYATGAVLDVNGGFAMH